MGAEPVKVAGIPSLKGVALMPKVRVNLLLSMTNGFSNSYIISTISRAAGTNNPARRIISLLIAPIFGGLSGCHKHLRDQIALGDGRRAGDVPDLTERFVAFAEDRHRFTDIQRIGEGVRRVEAAHAARCFACQRRIKNLIAIDAVAAP